MVISIFMNRRDRSLIHFITADVINRKDNANEGNYKNKKQFLYFVFPSAAFSYEKIYINLVTAKYSV